MDLRTAVEAMQNLGVSLNDYDSEALQTLIDFCFDVLQPHDEPAEHFEHEWYLRGDVIERLEATMKNWAESYERLTENRNRLAAENTEMLELLELIEPYIGTAWVRLQLRAALAKHKWSKEPLAKINT